MEKHQQNESNGGVCLIWYSSEPLKSNFPSDKIRNQEYQIKSDYEFLMGPLQEAGCGWGLVSESVSSSSGIKEGVEFIEGSSDDLLGSVSG